MVRYRYDTYPNRRHHNLSFVLPQQIDKPVILSFHDRSLDDAFEQLDVLYEYGYRGNYAYTRLTGANLAPVTVLYLEDLSEDIVSLFLLYDPTVHVEWETENPDSRPSFRTK